jgi:hypothetical protein
MAAMTRQLRLVWVWVRLDRKSGREFVHYVVEVLLTCATVILISPRRCVIVEVFTRLRLKPSLPD